jgi:hypothetical protein
LAIDPPVDVTMLLVLVCRSSTVTVFRQMSLATAVPFWPHALRMIREWSCLR